MELFWEQGFAGASLSLQEIATIALAALPPIGRRTARAGGQRGGHT